MELLVSKKVEITNGVPSLTTRMKFFITLLMCSLVALVISLVVLLQARDTAMSNQGIGMSSAATSMEDILSLLAAPVMMLLILFVGYLCQKIYTEYRAVYNPKNYGRSRKRNFE